MKQLPRANASALTFSVVIPVWNGIAHLPKCLEALVRGGEWIRRDLPMGQHRGYRARPETAPAGHRLSLCPEIQANYRKWWSFLRPTRVPILRD